MPTFFSNPASRPALDDQTFADNAFSYEPTWGEALDPLMRGGVRNTYGLGTALRTIETRLPSPFTEQKPWQYKDGKYVNETDGAELDEDAWKKSEFYREGVEYSSGMTEGRAKRIAAAHDEDAVYQWYAAKRPWQAMFTGFAGGLADPINYVPVVSQYSTGMNLAGKVGLAAVDAALNTGASAVLTAPLRAQLGDDVSVGEVARQMAYSAVAGSILGGAFHLMGSRRAAYEVSATQGAASKAAIVLNNVSDDIANGRPVKLWPASEDAIRSMHAQITKAVDDAIQSPRWRTEAYRVTNYTDGVMKVDAVDGVQATRSTDKRVSPPIGSKFDDWIDAFYTPEAMAEAKAGTAPARLVNDGVVFRGVSPEEWDAAQAAGAFKALGQGVFVEPSPDRYVGGGAYGARKRGRIVEFDVNGLSPRQMVGGRGTGDTLGYDEIPVGRVRRVWEWSAKSEAHELVYDKTAPATPPGIRVYHGSPHDFDRFDMSKIGTGEGAQAYGHGLYFAESEAVARSYRPQLDNAEWNAITKIGLDLADVPRAELDATAKAMLAGKNVNLSDQQFADLIESFTSEGDAAQQAWSRLDVSMQKYGGPLYEARIKANPDDFLDWDKPLPENIAQALRDKGFGNLGYQGEEGYAKAGDVINRYRNTDISGALRDMGIPGIKYRAPENLDDGASISRNYVVFDDSLIEIVGKNGEPVAKPMDLGNLHQWNEPDVTLGESTLAEFTAAEASALAPTRPGFDAAKADVDDAISHGVNPETGATDWDADIQAMRAAEQVNAEDLADLDAAARAFDEADAWGKALEVARTCFRGE